MAKLATKGTLLQKTIATVLTTIAQRVKLTGPSASMGVMEITDLDSTMEVRGATLLNPGTVGGTLWYDPNNTVHEALTTDFLAGTVGTYKLIFADGHTTPANINFTGFVTKFEPTGMEVKGFLQAEFEITLDGGTFTYIAGA